MRASFQQKRITGNENPLVDEATSSVFAQLDDYKTPVVWSPGYRRLPGSRVFRAHPYLIFRAGRRRLIPSNALISEDEHKVFEFFKIELKFSFACRTVALCYVDLRIGCWCLLLSLGGAPVAALSS